MVAVKQSTVSERRALLTDREREIITGEADVQDSYRYQTISRVRSRLDRLEDDLEAFEQHGDLADELRDIVCETSPADGRESAETAPEEPVDPSTGEQTRPADPADTRREQTERERAEERIRELGDVLEGGEKVFEIRLEAVLTIYDYLRDADSGRRKSDLEEFVDENDVDTGFQSGFGGLWSNWVKADSGKDRPNLLTELPGIELHGGYYTYTDGENE